jgi:lipopolysaccharide/colanic/teichoic acid biosynthesis glycosyltransferase
MGRAVKRTVDLVFAGCGLLLAVPLMALAAILTRLQGDGPAFYSQVRVTEGGRHFRIHKIRSMIPDAEPDARPIWPEDHDPRITPLGRTLRRYWIDELPQLLDVLAGNLSLVGPRPERPYFAQVFARTLPKYALRHQVKGGVTGLAQVSGYVGNTSIARRLHMDLRYVRRWTPVLDLIILALTVVRMFQRPPIEAQTGHPLGSPRVGEEVESSLPKPPSTST